MKHVYGLVSSLTFISILAVILKLHDNIINIQNCLSRNLKTSKMTRETKKAFFLQLQLPCLHLKNTNQLTIITMCLDERVTSANLFLYQYSLKMFEILYKLY